MGKVDDMRAMREARFAQAQKKNIGKKVSPAVAVDLEPLCGHQSISNKKCTRPAGHSEKNHRYT